MPKLVIANWKSNPVNLESAKTLFQDEVKSASKFTNVETVIYPPFVFIEELSTMLTSYGLQLKAVLGAQDISSESSGAHTGEVNADMLKSFGVKYVLIGHSEQRALGETDEIINKKITIALESNMIPIFLIGETEHNN